MPMEEMIAFLNKFNLSPEDVNEIIGKMFEGIAFKIQPTDLVLEVGTAKVFNVNAHMNRAPLVCDMALEIEGIDTSGVVAFTIPKIDYRSTEILALNIEVMPFNFPQIKFDAPAGTERGKLEDAKPDPTKIAAIEQIHERVQQGTSRVVNGSHI